MQYFHDLSLRLYFALFPVTAKPRSVRHGGLVLILLLGALPALAQETDIAGNPVVKFAWMIVQVILYGCGGIFAIIGLVGFVIGLMGDDAHRRNAGLKKLIGGLAIFGAPALTQWIYTWWSANSGEGVSLDEMYIPGINTP